MDLHNLKIDITEFEKSLTPEEVERFRPYIIRYHAVKNRLDRAIEILKLYGLDSNL